MTAQQPSEDRRPTKGRHTGEQYRRLLKRPRLTDREVEVMRQNMIRLAQTICEHVWGKEFY
jgi:tRNA C32,U32 (ribose-2'-O)-methylase TrmJ